MLYAEVSVNSPIAQRRTFSYSIPGNLNVGIGQAVWIPFGDKILQGIVLEINPHPSVEETKDITGVIDPQPLLSPAYVKLAHWISDHYLCPIFDAVALMLPPGFERKTLTFISTSAAADGYDPSSLPVEQGNILNLLQERGRVSLSRLEKILGKKKAQNIVSQLVASNLAVRSYELEPVRIKPREESCLTLTIDASEAKKEAVNLLKKRAVKQAALLDFLANRLQPMPLSLARKEIGFNSETIRSLAKKGLAKIQSVEVKRQPPSPSNISPSPLPILSTAQKSAIKSIRESLTYNKPSVFLLHGVTGSGKTEVYLQAMAETVRLGKRGIVLVPEIALTPQTIDRFAVRFPGRVAVLHSKLSLGEQFDQWRQIRDGRFDVVIGARSAIFAPQAELGLIVIDEEHEWSYKQDISPRYHARSVAIKLAELTGATVVLGSATPDVEICYHAHRADYRLLHLPERLTPRHGSALPEVTLIDLKEELKAGNSSIFSRCLKQSVNHAINNGEQVILFLNRRGAASFIQCRRCGFVLKCRRCQVSLSYHPAENILICHQCNYRTRVPEFCPDCSSKRMKFLGIGTQKLEQEAAIAFPGARLLRWDSDATRGKHSHREIMDRFRNHDADILIGTQMVAKGLALPLVTLVGVVSADTSLNLPDFRAGERTFQLLCQVAGRAGRGALGGRVIIQSYRPEHYAIQAAVGHDYTSFYRQEIAYRRQLNNPPFSQLVRLIFSHTNNVACQEEAARMKQILATELDSRGIADVSLLGPSPSFIQRLRGRYRWQIMLRGTNPALFLSMIYIPRGWIIDVEPLDII
ncbi:MAG TPA: primosomal protein N' [Dehalococcoidia bacterium]|nr:primosomal protein N' [Dehalococcoidia bacterium]